MKTRAAVCRKFGAPLRIEEVELADPGPGEVRVKIAACAICHSDIYFLEGAWGGELPAVYGHEAAGVIESVGPGVTRLKVGDPVVATLIRSCGFCPACSEGAPVFCEEVFPLDRQSPLTDHSGASIVHGMRIGAFAEHVVVDASQVALIPRDMPLDSASLIACGVITGMGAVVNTATVRRRNERRRDRLRRRRAEQHPGRPRRRRRPDHRRRHRGRQARRRARFRRHALHQCEDRGCRRARRRIHGRPQGRLCLRDRRRRRRDRTGDRTDEAQRRDRPRRHAAFRSDQHDRSDLAGRSRTAHPRLEDGLGATARGCAAESSSSIARGASSSTS